MRSDHDRAIKPPGRSSAAPLDQEKKIKLRKILILLFLFIAAQASSAAEDWKIAFYNKAEALSLARDKAEAEILTRHEPKMVEFYAVYTPYEDAIRKMTRYVFEKQLKENPQSIDWKDFKEWAWGWSFGTKEQENLAVEDTAYRALREKFLAEKEMMKKAQALTRMRNKVYEQHSEELTPLEENLFIDLNSLQAEVDKRMSNTPLEPSR